MGGIDSKRRLGGGKQLPLVRLEPHHNAQPQLACQVKEGGPRVLRVGGHVVGKPPPHKLHHPRQQTVAGRVLAVARPTGARPQDAADSAPGFDRLQANSSSPPGAQRLVLRRCRLDRASIWAFAANASATAPLNARPASTRRRTSSIHSLGIRSTRFLPRTMKVSDQPG